tara:strand:+ start:374 stop:2587 length:2214 start_codon:yes stop_codon:yes gene_type:complete
MQNNTILRILIASAIYLLCFGHISADQEPIKVESIDAENVSTDELGDLKLSGNVYIKTNYLEFWSQKATYNNENQSFILEGEVKVLSKNLSIDTNELMANLSSQTFFLSKTSFTLLDRTFGKADKFSVLASGNVELLNTSFNNCSKDDPFWEISAKKITLLKDEQNVVIRDISLKIGKVPVFYFPYLRAAIGKERLSGFLTPSIRQGKDGLDLSLPYYFNIATNQDLTITPRYIEERGNGLGLSYRYLGNMNEGEISLFGLSKDRKYKQETGKKSSRWRGSWSQSSNFDNKIFSEIKYEDASDEFYFRDVNDDLIGNTRKDYLQRNVNIWWKTPKIKLGLSLKESQSLNPFSLEDYKSVPLISLSAFKKRNDLLFIFSSNYGVFEQERINSLSQRPERIKRAFFQPELRYKKNFNSSDFSFSLGSEEAIYRVDNKKIERSTPWLEIEYKVYLEKDINESYSLLTPIVKYINIKSNAHKKNPQIDTRQRSQSFQNLYKRNWFSGEDLVSDRNRVILGFEHFVSSKRSVYTNYFSLGRALLKEKDQPLSTSGVINHSALVGEFKSFLNDRTWLTGMLDWNSTESQLNSGFINIAHESDTGFNLNIRSSYRKSVSSSYLVPWADHFEPVKNIEFSSQWPVFENLTVFAKLKKDLEKSSSSDILYGFQYSNCCLKAGLMKRKWKEQDYFSWQVNYSDPFSALSNGYDPIKERDNIYIFLEFKQMGRLGKEISDVISSTLLE